MTGNFAVLRRDLGVESLKIRTLGFSSGRHYQPKTTLPLQQEPSHVPGANPLIVLD